MDEIVNWNREQQRHPRRQDQHLEAVYADRNLTIVI
jgi:hypothetical protein